MSGHDGEKPHSRARVMFDALEQLRDEPEVITIRRQPTRGTDVRGHWVIETAGHSTGHERIEMDAEIMINVLMRAQERDLP